MGSYKKKLFIVLLVTLLIGFFVCGSVNANTDYNFTTDTTTTLINYQETLANMFISSMIKKNNTVLIQQFKSYNQYYNSYFTARKDNNNNIIVYCYFYPSNSIYDTNTEVDSSIMLWNDANLLVPCSGYNVDYSFYNLNNLPRFQQNIFTNNGSKSDYTGSFFLPSLLINYRNVVVDNYANGINPDVNTWAFVVQAIQENTEQQEETTNEMKELNNFMKSEDVDQDAYNYPTNNPTQDPTTDGINNIFNKFYSRITNWDSSNINVYIPFANKTFTIPANASEQLLAKFSNMGLGSTLKSLINAVWFYVLARYIIKDVQKYADGLKTGEILTKSDTNIKTEML